jgi:hypothetical protein
MPVAYSVYHMHRRADLYNPDPLAFRPERWNGSELANIGWGYLPFNGGPRLCLGSKFEPYVLSLERMLTVGNQRILDSCLLPVVLCGSFRNFLT